MRLIKRLPRFARAYREMETIGRREDWTRDQIQAHQLQRLNEIWAHAIEHVPWYRRLAREQKLPGRFASVAEFQASVPILPKGPVRTGRMDFLSERPLAGKWHVTGGSTGAPTTVFRSHEAHREMLRARYRFHATWGVDIFDRWAYLWGHGASFAPGLPGLIDRVRRPLNDRLRNRLRLSAYRLGSDDLRRHLERLVVFDPVAIYAYSTAGLLLARQAEAMGVRLKSLKMVNLTAEPVFPHMVAAVDRAFGVPTVMEYGSIECGFLAGDNPDGTLRVREDNVLIETPPRADGRCDIVVTVLNNPSFPLLRYAIGDVTDAPLKFPERGFAILHNVGGRDNDLVFGRDGEPLHSVWFDYLFEHYPTLRRYQVHQHADGAIDINCELVAPDAQLDIDGLRERIQAHVGYPVRAEIVAEAPQTPAGKHRWIRSDFAAAGAGHQQVAAGA